MAKVTAPWWTFPSAITAFNANNAAALAALQQAQNQQPAQANQWGMGPVNPNATPIAPAMGPANPNAAPAMPAMGPVNPNAARSPYQPVNGWMPPENMDANGVLQYTYTPPANPTPPQWVQTAAQIGDVLAAPSRAIGNLIFPGNAAYRPDALKSDVRGLWEGKTPEWFAPADRYEGIVERELARDFRNWANAWETGDLGTIADTTARQSAMSMIPPTIAQFQQNPSLLTGAQVAMSAMGAMLPLMPKALFPVTNAPTQGVEALIGGMMSAVPVPGGAMGEMLKATASAGGLEKTLQDVPGTMRRIQDEIDAAKRSEKPLLSIEESTHAYANTFVKAMADAYGKDFSQPYRQAGGFFDRPYGSNAAGAVLRGDDPTTIDEVGRWVDYQSRHIVFSGPDARKEAIERMTAGENPQVALRGLVQPPADALDDEIALWEQSVQNHMAVTERVVYTKARMGGATEEQARQAAAEVVAEAERYITEYGMIKGSEQPLSEGLLQTLVGFSPLDAMNVASLGKIFGWQRLLPKARAQGQAATLSRVYDASARNAAGYTMAEEVAAAKRGLSPEMVAREARAKETLGLDTQGDQPTPRPEATFTDDAPANAPGASANGWQKFGAQAYLQYIKLAELLPQAQGHMVQGYAMDMLHNLTRGAKNGADAARRIQAFVDEPGSLVAEMGSVPLSVKAEFARPVIREGLDGIMKVLSGADNNQGGRLDHGALLEGWIRPTEMAAFKLMNVKQLADRSVLERWGFAMKGWLGEFALRTPGYAIRNAISDSVVMAMDGIYSLDTYKDLTNFLGKYKIDRSLITGKRPEEFRESKFSRVPVVGTVQNAIGRMNEVWDDGRRVRAFTTAFRQFMGMNYKPIISDGAKQILGPQFGDAVAKMEQMWRTGSSSQEIRAMYEAVIAPRTAMDDFNLMGALEARGIPTDAVSPELGARVYGELRKATTEVEINHILDKYEDMIIQDQQARMALLGDVVSPKGITEKTVEMDSAEYRAMLDKIAAQAVKSGIMSQEDAVRGTDEMVRQVFEYEVAIHNARTAIGQALGYVGEGADMQRAHALLAYAMDMEYAIRNTARENQHKLYLQTIERIGNTRGILRRDGIGIRRAWDEYRRLNDAEQRTRLQEIAGIHRWTADAIIRMGTDWDALLLERPDIAKSGNMADRLLEQALELMRKGGVEDFDAMLLGKRTSIDLPRRESWRQAQVIARAEPALATHVFDVILATEKDVQMAAARTVGSVRLELARKDAGMIDLAEYDARVNTHWNHYFDFAANRYGKYAQAQLLWMQVRNSAVANGMRAMGWEDDAIADLLGKTEQAEGMIRAQEIIDQGIRGDAEPAPRPIRREAAPEMPEDPMRNLLEEADEAAATEPAAPARRTEISYPYDVDRLDGTKLVLSDAIREIMDNNIENAMDVAARFGMGEYEAGMLLRAAKATSTAAASKTAPGKAGREARAVGSTPDKKYRLRRWLVDLDDLIPSNTLEGAPDPRFPAKYQRRLRDRQGGIQQVNKMAMTFDSDAVLSDFRVVGRGAPTAIAENGKWVVLDGNGRTLLLKKLQRDMPQKYAQYVDDLKSRLAENGFSEVDLEGLRSPALISELLDDIDPVAFADEGNVRQSSAMSPFEKARMDASKLLDDAITKLTIGEDETVTEALTSLDNQPLVIGFIRTLAENDRNELVTKDAKTLNEDGVTRLKHALFVKVYPSEAGLRLAETFIENTIDGVKNIENAMFASLGQMARAEALSNSGARDRGLAFADDLATTVDAVARARRSKQKVDDFLNQIPIDGSQELSPLHKAMVRFFYENGGSPKVMREFVRGYADAVVNQPDTVAPTMAGMDQPVRTKQEIVYKLIADAARAKEAAAKSRLVGEPYHPSPYRFTDWDAASARPEDYGVDGLYVKPDGTYTDDFDEVVSEWDGIATPYEGIPFDERPGGRRAAQPAEPTNLDDGGPRPEDYGVDGLYVKPDGTYTTDFDEVVGAWDGIATPHEGIPFDERPDGRRARTLREPAGQSPYTVADPREAAIQLQRLAFERRGEFIGTVEQIAREVGAEVTGQSHAVKGIDRMMEKIQAGRRVTDALRTTVLVRNPNDWQQIIDRLNQSGFQTWISPKTGKPDIDNLFETATHDKPYRHVALKVVKSQDDPVVAEVLIMQPAMFEAKHALGHDSYKVARMAESIMRTGMDSPEILQSLERIYHEVDAFSDVLFRDAFARDNPGLALTSSGMDAGSVALTTSSNVPASTSALSRETGTVSPLAKNNAKESFRDILSRARQALLASGSKSPNTSEAISKLDTLLESLISQYAPYVSVPLEADGGRTFDRQHAYRVNEPDSRGGEGEGETGLLAAHGPSIGVETRPDTTPELARDGRNLIAELEFQDRPNQSGQAVRDGDAKDTKRGAVRQQGRVTTVASRLADSLRVDGTASLVGQKIQTPHDLGVLAQVFRNPRYETARYFFVDADGNIVGETGVSSRLPGISIIVPEGVEDDLQWLKGLIKSHNAASVWLLHNHPSGNVNPSAPDLNGTAQIAHGLGNAFGGHVIIDHNKFYLMQRKPNVEITNGMRFTEAFATERVEIPVQEPTADEVATYKATLSEQEQAEYNAVIGGKDIEETLIHLLKRDKMADPLLNPKPSDINIGWRIPGAGSDFARNLFHIATDYMTGNHPVLLGLSGDYRLNAIGTQVIDDIRAQDGMRIAAQIRAFGRNNGAAHVAMVIPKTLDALTQDDWRLIDFSITTMLLMDVVTADGRSVRSNSEASPSSWMKSQGTQLGTIPKGRALWDSGTQVDMFGNYIFDDAPKPAAEPKQPARQDTPRQTEGQAAMRVTARAMPYAELDNAYRTLTPADETEGRFISYVSQLQGDPTRAKISDATYLRRTDDGKVLIRTNEGEERTVPLDSLRVINEGDAPAQAAQKAIDPQTMQRGDRVTTWDSKRRGEIVTYNDERTRVQIKDDNGTSLWHNIEQVFADETARTDGADVSTQQTEYLALQARVIAGRKVIVNEVNALKLPDTVKERVKRLLVGGVGDGGNYDSIETTQTQLEFALYVDRGGGYHLPNGKTTRNSWEINKAWLPVFRGILEKAAQAQPAQAEQPRAAEPAQPQTQPETPRAETQPAQAEQPRAAAEQPAEPKEITPESITSDDAIRMVADGQITAQQTDRILALMQEEKLIGYALEQEGRKNKPDPNAGERIYVTPGGKQIRFTDAQAYRYSASKRAKVMLFGLDYERMETSHTLHEIDDIPSWDEADALVKKLMGSPVIPFARDQRARIAVVLNETKPMTRADVKGVLEAVAKGEIDPDQASAAIKQGMEDIERRAAPVRRVGIYKLPDSTELRYDGVGMMGGSGSYRVTLYMHDDDGNQKTIYQFAPANMTAAAALRSLLLRQITGSGTTNTGGANARPTTTQPAGTTAGAGAATTARTGGADAGAGDAGRTGGARGTADTGRSGGADAGARGTAATAKPRGAGKPAKRGSDDSWLGGLFAHIPDEPVAGDAGTTGRPGDATGRTDADGSIRPRRADAGAAGRAEDTPTPLDQGRDTQPVETGGPQAIQEAGEEGLPGGGSATSPRRTRTDVRGVHRGGSGVLGGAGDGTGNVEVGDTGGRTPAGPVFDQEVRDTDAGIHAGRGRGSGEDNGGVPQDTSLRLDDAPPSVKAETEAVRNDEARAIDDAWNALSDNDRAQFTDWLTTSTHPIAGENVPLATKYNILSRVFADEINDEPRSVRRGNGHYDYIISEKDAVGAGGAKTKYKANIEAIRILKAIEAESRFASPYEQAALVRYVGWGGLHQPVNTLRHYPDWYQQQSEVRDLLTPAELESAGLSTPNAHFTSIPIVDTMWQIMQRLGFGGGRVLEPSGGIGHFFGRMPRDVYARSTMTLVEMDSLTARIAKQLYQNADVHEKPYQEARIPNNWFDLSISNVPFGNYAVYDPAFRDNKAVTQSIHNYFFAKSLEHVRPGGVVAFITSRFTMDSMGDEVRKYIADRAELIGAFRLPNTAFEGNANTNVTTDVLFLRKRAPSEAKTGPSWLKTVTQTDPVSGREYEINEYYATNPDMLLGRMEVTEHGNTAGAEWQPNLMPTRPLEEMLRDVVTRFPEKVYTESIHVEADEAQMVAAMAEFKLKTRVIEGQYMVMDGRLHKVVRGSPVAMQYDAHKTAALSDGARVIETLQSTLGEMMNPNGTDASIAAQQKALNTQYDAFVKRYGRANDAKVAEFFADDPLYPRLLSLEKKNEWGAWDKADVFRKRVAGAPVTVTQTDSAQEALYASLFKHSRVDLGYISQLLRRGRDETIEALGDMVFHDPDGQYVTKAEYLSGDVVGKLEEARVAARTDERYMRNVEELEKVQPERIPAGKITARLGTPWIPTDVIESFITSVSGAKVQANHIEGTTDWQIEIKSPADPAKVLQYQTDDVSFVQLVRQALALKQPTVMTIDSEGNEHVHVAATEAAREKQKKVKELFEKWIWRDPARMGRLEDLYNRQFNAFVPRLWDGSHMQFPGMNPEITLNPHQKAGAYRIVSGQNVYLAHGVGTGKTFTMIAGGMELRRLGLRRKPMYSVPNNTLEQFAREFKMLYPMANIMVITPDDLTPIKRPRLVAQIATSDLDAVIVSHETFARFPVSADAQATFMREHIKELEDAITGEKKGSWRFKQLQKSKQDLEARLKKLLSGKKDDATLFEELGIDQLFVDEAHGYKNLRYTTRLKGVKGMGAPEGNMKTMDMMLKVRILNQMNGGGGVVYSSGTPVSNSLAETYTIMRYLQPNTLDQLGLKTFDAWAGAFAEVVESMEKTATGAKNAARLSGFVNMPELRFIMSETTDIKTQETLKLAVPEIEGGEPQPVVAEKSPEMKAIIADLVKRAKLIEKNPAATKLKGSDNILVVNGDAKAAALDIRTYAKGLPDVPGSKLNTVVKNALEIYQQTADYNGTQMIFCDFSKPKRYGGGQRTGFSAYDDIIEKLIAGGIPKAQIASIYEWDTPVKKAQLNKVVNEGKVRVVLGSTDKLGTGINMQKRLFAAHHLDIPYTPAKMEQRNGRIVRQGNLHKEWGKPVKILNYVTKGTFDEVMWALLRKKGSFVSTFMSEKPLGRKGVDDSALILNAKAMEMASSDDPSILRQAELENEIMRYDNLYSEYLYQRQHNGVKISQSEGALERQREESRKLSRAEAVYRVEKQKPFAIEWNYETHTLWNDEDARTTVNKAMIAWAKEPGDAPPAGERKILGELRGMRLEWDGRYDSPDTKFRGVEHLFHASLEGRKMIEAQMEVGPVITVVVDQYGNGETIGKFILSPQDGAQNLTRVENILNGIAVRYEAATNKMRGTENLLRELRMQMAQTFEHDEAWDRAKVELAELKSKFSVQDEVIDEVDAIERNEDYTGREAKVFQEEGAPDPYAAQEQPSGMFSKKDKPIDANTQELLKAMEEGRRGTVAEPTADEQIDAARLADAPVPVDGLVAQDADAEMTGNTGETHMHQSLLDHVTQQQLEALSAIRDGALKHLGDAPKRSKPVLSAAQLKALEAEVQQAIRTLNETVDAGKTYANERSNFALMDYGNKRGFDLWLSAVAPFYYWATRQGRNFILRMADNPQFLIAYWRYKEAMKKHNKRRGTRKRFETALRIPTRDLTGGAMDDVYWDPTTSFFAFDQMYGEGYDENATGLQGLYNTASQFGMRPHPIIDVPLRLTGALTSKSPNQEGYAAEQAEWGPGSIGKLLQQSSVVQAVTAALSMGQSGMGINPEAPLRKALGINETEGFDAYLVARSISNLAAEQNKAYGEQFDRRPYLAAQEFTAKHTKDLPTALTSMKPAEIAAELGIDPTTAAYALQIAQHAARMAAQERGTRQLASILGGQRLVAHPQGEYERAEMSRQERGAAYNPYTQQGSRADVQAVQRANPALEVQRAQYGTLPGEETDYRWLFDRAMQDEINTKFDTLKEQVIVMRPWDRKAGYAIEDARRAALDRVDRDKMTSTAAWQDDYLKAMNAASGTSVVPQSVAPAVAMQTYKPRSVAGANPTEKVEIRQQEIMQQVSRTQPRAESFMTPKGEIDYRAYRLALDEWRGSLGKVAAGLPATQMIMAKATEEGNAATLKQFMAGLTGDQLDQYRWRYDSPLEAAQRTYYEAIYTPVMESYVQMRDQGDTEAWDKTIGAVGAIAGPMLADLTNRLYQGRFTPEQLAEVQRINIPAMAEVMRLNQGPEAKAKTQARDDFWNVYNTGIPPGNASYELKQNPMVALILDRDSRGTATTEQYELAAASMRQFVQQNYGGVEPDWAQARAEKANLDKIMVAQYGADAPRLVQSYDFAGNAERQAALRAQYPILNTILLMRYQYEQAHPVYALYHARKVAKSEQTGVGIAAPDSGKPGGGGASGSRSNELGVLTVRRVGR